MKQLRQGMITGILFNTLIWYDFTIFGVLATTINKLFFPTKDYISSLIYIFSTFAASFIVRPAGGIIFGYIGDKFGRDRAMISSALLLAFSTACVGTIPTHFQSSALPFVLLTLLRLLQGIAIGGAYCGSIVILLESASPQYRVLAGSTAIIGVVLGTLFASLVSWFVSYMLGSEKFLSFGWRIPFLLGAITYFIILRIQRCFNSPIHAVTKRVVSDPFVPFYELMLNYKLRILQIMGILLLVSIPFYTLSIFMTTFMYQMGYSMEEALLFNTTGLVVMLVSIPLSAITADLYGRKIILVMIAFLFLVLTIPMFQWLCLPYSSFILKGYLLFAALTGSYMGLFPSLLAEAFPSELRYTGASFSHNLSMALFGGTTPLFLTLIIGFTKNNPALAEIIEDLFGRSEGAAAIYVMFAAAIAFITLLCYSSKHE